MSNRYIKILLPAVMLLLPSLAFAADGEASSALSQLLGALLEVLVPAGAVFTMWLAHKLIKTFEAKTKIDVPERTEKMIDEWVAKGVAYAEEKARSAIKNKAAKVKGPEKLELAASFVLDMAEKYKLTDLAKDKVEKLVESKLNSGREE